MPDKNLNTLVYIDDDASLRSIVEIALATIGNYEVKLCSSGLEALEILQDFHPDMILLDLVMPEMDGFETLEKIRQIESLKNIPVVFMTAHSDARTLKSFRQAGAAGSISKPFNPIRLAEQIQTLWNKYG